jgi:tetratricopeptide (TPR) repeat protein
VDPDAYEAYLKGRHLLDVGTEATIRSALELFNGAIEKDPGSALPYTGVADAYAMLRSVYASPHEVMPKAKAAARRAVELDDTLPAAHVSLGNAAFFYDFDWSSAEKEFRRALELNPSSGKAHDAYANLLSALGRHDEAFREIDRATELDPLSSLVRADAAWIAYLARAYPRAVEAGREAARLAPDSWWAHTSLGLAYEKTGKIEEAIAELGRARAIDDNTTVLEILAGVYATAGRREDAVKFLDVLSERAKRSYVCPYEVATAYAGIGEREHAIEWLFKSKEERADCLPWAGSDAKLDSLREDPRFRELLKSIGLPSRPAR